MDDTVAPAVGVQELLAPGLTRRLTSDDFISEFDNIIARDDLAFEDVELMQDVEDFLSTTTTTQV